MAEFNQTPDQPVIAFDAQRPWSWLQSQLDRTALAEASGHLDQWFVHRLDLLESDYADLITDRSRQRALAQLIQSSR